MCFVFSFVTDKYCNNQKSDAPNKNLRSALINVMHLDFCICSNVFSYFASYILGK